VPKLGSCRSRPGLPGRRQAQGQAAVAGAARMVAEVYQRQHAALTNARLALLLPARPAKDSIAAFPGALQGCWVSTFLHLRAGMQAEPCVLGKAMQGRAALAAAAQ
jgi:hypothetical protein